MFCLRKHIKGVEGGDGVACFGEVFEVAGEGAWVAGDVDDLAGVEFDQRLAGFGVQSGAGWVKQDEVDGFYFVDQVGQDGFNGAFKKADIVEFIQIINKIEAGGGRAFDSDQFAGERCDEAGKETHAAVKFKDAQVFFAFELL